MRRLAALCLIIGACVSVLTPSVLSAPLPMPRQADYPHHFPLTDGISCEGREGYVMVMGVKNTTDEDQFAAFFVYWVDGTSRGDKPFGVLLRRKEGKVRMYWDADRNGLADETFDGTFDAAVDAFTTKYGASFCENVAHLK